MIPLNRHWISFVFFLLVVIGLFNNSSNGSIETVPCVILPTYLAQNSVSPDIHGESFENTLDRELDYEAILTEEISYMFFQDNALQIANLFEDITLEFPNITPQQIETLINFGLYDSRYRYISSSLFNYFKNVNNYLKQNALNYIKYTHIPRVSSEEMTRFKEHLLQHKSIDNLADMPDYYFCQSEELYIKGELVEGKYFDYVNGERRIVSKQLYLDEDRLQAVFSYYTYEIDEMGRETTYLEEKNINRRNNITKIQYYRKDHLSPYYYLLEEKEYYYNHLNYQKLYPGNQEIIEIPPLLIQENLNETQVLRIYRRGYLVEDLYNPEYLNLMKRSPVVDLYQCYFELTEYYAKALNNHTIFSHHPIPLNYTLAEESLNEALYYLEENAFSIEPDLNYYGAYIKMGLNKLEEAKEMLFQANSTEKRITYTDLLIQVQLKLLDRELSLYEDPNDALLEQIKHNIKENFDFVLLSGYNNILSLFQQRMLKHIEPNMVYFVTQNLLNLGYYYELSYKMMDQANSMDIIKALKSTILASILLNLYNENTLYKEDLQPRQETIQHNLNALFSNYFDFSTDPNGLIVSDYLFDPQYVDILYNDYSFFDLDPDTTLTLPILEISMDWDKDTISVFLNKLCRFMQEMDNEYIIHTGVDNQPETIDEDEPGLTLTQIQTMFYDLLAGYDIDSNLVEWNELQSHFQENEPTLWVIYVSIKTGVGDMVKKLRSAMTHFENGMN